MLDIIKLIIESSSKLIAFIGIAFILLRTPFIGKYIAVINTLIHEVGHALVAILTFGKIDKIELFANTNGTAWSSNRFWVGRVLTSLAGYPIASATSYLFLYFAYNQNYTYILVILIVILVLSFIFWVRNIYGLFWIITSLGFIIIAINSGNVSLIENILLFISSILLVESIFSAFVIFKLSFIDPKNAGDATSLARSTILLPASIWGIFFFAQSLFFGYHGIKLFMK